MDKPHEQLDRRGLPRPVRAEVTEDLALLDTEGDVEDAVTSAVVLCQGMR